MAILIQVFLIIALRNVLGSYNRQLMDVAGSHIIALRNVLGSYNMVLCKAIGE